MKPALHWILLASLLSLSPAYVMSQEIDPAELPLQQITQLNHHDDPAPSCGGAQVAGVPACAIPSGTSKTYFTQFTGMNYRLKRQDTPDGRPVFEATVNLQFVSDRHDPNHPPSPYAQAIEERADACYAALGDVHGPNGEILRIRRAVGAEKTQIPANVVEITPIMREDDLDWYKDVDCSTIVHETFHHLGLVDVYSELTDSGMPKTTTLPNGKNIDLWDCRANGPKDSVMAFEWIALGEVYGYYERLTCVCEQDGFRACSAALKSIHGVPDSCPSGAENSTTSLYKFPAPFDKSTYDLNALDIATQGSFASSAVEQGKSQGYLKGTMTENWRYQGMKWVQGTRTGVLYPAEFRMIAYPDCQQENATYRACANNAYRTSEVEGCAPMPPQCSDPNQWLQ